MDRKVTVEWSVTDITTYNYTFDGSLLGEDPETTVIGLLSDHETDRNAVTITCVDRTVSNVVITNTRQCR